MEKIMREHEKRNVVEICGFDIDDKANLDKLRAVTYCLQDMVR